MTAQARTTRRTFLAHTLALGAAGPAAGQVRSQGGAQTLAASSVDSWQIGIYTRPWGQFEYPAALDAIAEAGYKYLGLMTIKSKKGVVISADSTVEEARKVGEEAAKRGLKIVSVYGGSFPVDKKSIAPGILGLKRLIDNVAACDGRSLLLGGIGKPDLEERYYKTVAECCGYAVEKKVTITLKPHGPLNATGRECRDRWQRVGKKGFRIWYDPGNVLYYSDGKLDAVEDAATVDGLVCGMSVKDYQAPKRVDVTPGTGLVKFPAVMARLKKGGFTGGPLVVECLAPGDLKTLLEEAKKARTFVENLIRA